MKEWTKWTNVFSVMPWMMNDNSQSHELKINKMHSNQNDQLAAVAV